MIVPEDNVKFHYCKEKHSMIDFLKFKYINTW